MSKEYLAWYTESRCEYRDEMGQCEQEREIIIDKHLLSEERVVGKYPKKTSFFYPSHDGKYCYYHRKKKEGKFNYEVTRQKSSGYTVSKGSNRS